MAGRQTKPQLDSYAIFLRQSIIRNAELKKQKYYTVRGELPLNLGPSAPSSGCRVKRSRSAWEEREARETEV